MARPTLDVVEAEKALCALSLADFVRLSWHVLEPATPIMWGWAVQSMCDHLEAVTDGRIKRLLINVPPGTMKSLLVSVLWPAWEWGPIGRPDLRYIGTAHKQDLAVRDSTKCRRLIQSDWYQSRWPIALTSDQNAKTKFENGSTGFREAVAFTSMTGSRADRIILDDPHSVDGAKSPAMLAADIETFREALPSRVNNADSAIVIVMQRLHEEDVSAVALKLGYEHLKIPMRYEPGESRHVVGMPDPRTDPDELMFPDRFGEAQVKALELSLGEYAGAGQLQQRPAPRSGGMFKPGNIEIVEALPAGLRFTRGWDLAASKNSGDWTVGGKLAVKDGITYIADVPRERGSPDDVERMIVNTSTADGRLVFQSLPQDPGQAGKAQAAYLSKKMQGRNFEFTTETGDKATRASPFASQVNAGNVKMLKADWNEVLINEMRVFPAGKHDDQIDALSRAYNRASQRRISIAEML